MIHKKPANRARQRTSQPRTAVQRGMPSLAKLISGRKTILPSELAKVGIIKDSGQSLDLKAARNLHTGTMFSYTLPPIKGRYSSFLGRIARGTDGKPIFILTHKNNGGIYTKLARPIRREFTKGAKQANMLIEMRLLPGRTGVRKRSAIKLP